MEIAYLVLAHEKPHQLARLLQALGTEGARIFVHVDLAASLEAFVANCAYIRNVEWARHRVDVRWGGFGVVQATLNLMSQALEAGRYDYLLLLSGADYPIVSNARIVAELDSGNGSEFINCTPMPAPEVGKPMSRLDRYFFAPKNRRNVFARLLNRALRIGPRRNPSRALGHMQPYGGSGWWCLSSACATYVLEFVQENPAFVRFFRRTCIPDEMFFQTIVANSRFARNIRPALFYADWSRKAPPYPAVLDSTDLHRLRGSGRLFARKFDIDGDPGVFDLIDRELR